MRYIVHYFVNRVKSHIHSVVLLVLMFVVAFCSLLWKVSVNIGILDTVIRKLIKDTFPIPNLM